MTLADDFLAKGEAKGLRKGEAKGLRKGLRKGRIAAKAEAVLGVLEHRRLRVSKTVRKRVLTTEDEALLQRWFHRAFTASTLAEVFES